MPLNCGVGEDLRVPWTARRSNQLILKEISPEYSLVGLMLKLKLQYFGHLMHWKRSWCWEKFRAGGKGDDTGWDGWMVSPTGWAWVWAISRGWWWTGKPALLQSMGSQRVGHNWVTELKLNQSGLLPNCPPRPKTVCRWQAGYEILMLVVGAAWDMFGPKLPWLHP